MHQEFNMTSLHTDWYEHIRDLNKTNNEVAMEWPIIVGPYRLPYMCRDVVRACLRSVRLYRPTGELAVYFH
jgi:hypothetical protein